MNELLIRPIQAWVDDQLARVNVEDPVTIHIDQLTGAPAPGRNWFEVALRAYPILVDYVRSTGELAQPMLGITLRFGGRKVRQAVPHSVEDVERRWRRVEPPSLYLLDWSLCRYRISFESYRVPLPFPLFTPPLEGVYTDYEAERGMEEAAANEPFARFVTARYFPEQYRLS